MGLRDQPFALCNSQICNLTGPGHVNRPLPIRSHCERKIGQREYRAPHHGACGIHVQLL